MNEIEASNSLIAINDELDQSNETEEALAKLRQRSRFTLFLAWIALFFTVIGIAAGYKNWMQINDRAKQAAIGVSELTEKASHFADKSTVVALNEQLLNDLDKGRRQLEQSVETLERVGKTTQRAAKGVDQQAILLTQQQESSRATAPSPNTVWRLAELRFLLQIANQRLHLSNDKNGALQALNMAETALLKLGSTKYLAVRKKMNEEIVLLELFLTPNLTAISQRIADLIEIIDAMPVEDEIEKQQKITLLPEIDAKQNELLSRLIGTINDAVVIRKFDQSVQKTMGVDEKEKLKNLLHLRFETLRLMVLQGLDYDYHQQLKLIKQTLGKYYPTMINGSLQKLLDELDNVKLSPSPPDISGSLKLLDQISKVK
ncbi:MAG: uroporphyrinogen-III C-methyltransferase [Cocleimonas sp.]|nr:uroporphyrinogen-III C-methyltransferase [Cocleimonas sp.]